MEKKKRNSFIFLKPQAFISLKSIRRAIIISGKEISFLFSLFQSFFTATFAFVLALESIFTLGGCCIYISKRTSEYFFHLCIFACAAQLIKRNLECEHRLITVCKHLSQVVFLFFFATRKDGLRASEAIFQRAKEVQPICLWSGKGSGVL